MDDRILLGLVVGGVTGVVALLYTYGKEQFEYFLVKRKENQIKKVNEEIENQPINRTLKSIENLEDLRDSGLLTENEYQEKAQKLRDKILLEQIKETEEYNKLNDLFDRGVLSSDEFHSKLKLLQKSHVVNDNSNIIENKKLTPKNELPKQKIENKFILSKYLIPIFVFAVIIIMGLSFYQNSEFYKQYKQNEDEVEELYNSTSNETNNYEETNSNEVYQQSFKVKKFVYVCFKLQKPKYKYVQLDGLASSDRYSTVQKFYSTEWEEMIFSTEIIEIEDYNEDSKNKIFDQAESKMFSTLNNYDTNYITEVNFYCNDAYERDILLKAKSKILESNIYEFDSYSEASLHKRNLQ